MLGGKEVDKRGAEPGSGAQFGGLTGPKRKSDRGMENGKVKNIVDRGNPILISAASFKRGGSKQLAEGDRPLRSGSVPRGETVPESGKRAEGKGRGVGLLMNSALGKTG